MYTVVLKRIPITLHILTSWQYPYRCCCIVTNTSCSVTVRWSVTLNGHLFAIFIMNELVTSIFVFKENDVIELILLQIAFRTESNDILDLHSINMCVRCNQVWWNWMLSWKKSFFWFYRATLRWRHWMSLIQTSERTGYAIWRICCGKTTSLRNW